METVVSAGEDGPRAAGNVAGAPTAKEAWNPEGKMEMAETEAADGVNALAKVKWQWKHRDGFRNYGPDESARIESYFQTGTWMMRMKSGSGNKTNVREVFFYDMIQYDPQTKKQRDVRRVPEPTAWLKFKRLAMAWTKGLLSGDEFWWKPKSKAFYEKLRNEYEEPEPVEVFRVNSIFYKIIVSWTFNTCAALMILFNSIYIWADADFNEGTTYADTPWVFIVFDNIWCSWFLVEAIIRAGAFKTCKAAVSDGWFVMDVLLVIFMVFETWGLQLAVYLFVGKGQTSQLNKISILRALRLLRLSRIARLFKIFPQLVVMMKGMYQAMKSLIYTLLLLIVLTFITAVIFKNLSDMDDTLKALEYDSVGGAFWNLMIYGTFLDNVGGMLDSLKESSIWYALFFIAYIFISNLTMLNMLIGVLCEVLARVTDEEANLIEKVELEKSITEILECYDLKNDRLLGVEEFQALMGNPDLKVVLGDHDIDHNDLQKLEDVLFHEGIDENGQKAKMPITFPTFLEKVLQLRGGNAATVGDVVELRGFLNSRFEVMEKACTILKGAGSGAPAAPATRGRIDTLAGSAPELVLQDAGAPVEEFMATVMSELDKIRARQDVVQLAVHSVQLRIEEIM